MKTAFVTGFLKRFAAAVLQPYAQGTQSAANPAMILAVISS
jgi:hypothetical protein